MRKKYLHDRYGSENDFWDMNWQQGWDSQAQGAPSVDPVLAREMVRYLPAGAAVLEGGCGNCHYLRWLQNLGCKATGIDFAERTVAAALASWPGLDVRVGDITDLPFQDGSFDAYYSGGVIEHFEEGPDRPLAEARRVLKADGWFLVTVPHLNWIRQCTGRFFRRYQAVDLDGREAYVLMGLDSFSTHEHPDGFHFHEYAFSTREMRRFLRDAGFTIHREVPFSSAWGFLDVDAFQHLYNPPAGGRHWWNRIFGLPLRAIRRLEQGEGPISRGLARLAGALAGNLKLYACRPTPARTGTTP